MSLSKVFDIAGSGMNAQSVRMNVTASNLANAGSVSGDPNNVYRARQPVFSTFSNSPGFNTGVAEVRLAGVIESSGPLMAQHMPEHPEADENGMVYISDVNMVEEMVNMLSASKSYQNGVEMINTTKDLLLQTLSLGR
jgi:flagellar basal-body rod protein FlgC